MGVRPWQLALVDDKAQHENGAREVFIVVQFDRQSRHGHGRLPAFGAVVRMPSLPRSDVGSDLQQA
jgi:hypothetical protein